MKKGFIIPLLLLLAACTGNSNNTTPQQTATNELNKPTNNFALENEKDYLHYVREVSKRLCLYDLQNGTDSFELRIWYINSMWEPHKLYILKGIDSSWTLFHYLYYRKHARFDNDEYKRWDGFKDPRIDSIKLETLQPRKISWQYYISNLQLDSLWNLKTESEIKGKSFGVVDGYRCVIEIRNKQQYKYLFYTEPEYFQKSDSNHKRFIEFEEKLITPVMYKDIVNP